MASLIFRDGQGRDGTVELSPTTPVFVGRGLDCAIRTDDGMVSRRHAQFAMENGQFIVEDLGSSNGTHVNGVRIQKQAITHTDVIQCGSLIVRFVDQGGEKPVRRGTSPPPKKGGTMVLDRDPAPRPPTGFGGANFAGPSGANFPGPGGANFPGPGGANFPGPGDAVQMASAGSAAPTPFGGPPGMPAGTMPYGARPGLPSSDASPSKLPFGGPPKMPPDQASRDSSRDAGEARRRSSAPTAPPPRRQDIPTSSQSPSAFSRSRSEDAEIQTMSELGVAELPRQNPAEVEALQVKLEQISANYEREVADGKRARAEAGTLRDRIEELRAALHDGEEQVAARDRVADQLRDELQQLRSDHTKLKSDMAELADNAAARERQAARAQEDSVKVRDQMQDLNRQLMELSRTKDEGWTKLNDQLTEIDQLRSVINEQERMLEDRRVGLVSQEHAIKELRSDKERSLQLIAQLKAEREHAATEASRTSAQVVAVEEENRRLGRLLVEAHSDQARGGDVDQMARLTADMKDVRVELKKAEADRDRVQQQHEAAERDRRTAEDRLARLEVELQEAVAGKLAAESSRGAAQEALAKSELARQKAIDDATAAARAAMAVAAPAAPALPISDATAGEFSQRVREIYDSVSDILSEMRNNLTLVQREVPKVTAADQTMKAIDDAVEALVDSAETAKGALRALRDLAEGKL